MTRSTAAALMLLLAGCRPSTVLPTGGNDAGSRLERTAIAAGLVADPGTPSLVGFWGSGAERACVVGGEGKDSRIGVLIDYGAGQGCMASGTVRRTDGNGLDVRLGGCRVAARLEGVRIVFPAEVPAACDTLCTGRASIAAMTVERQSPSQAEAASLRTSRGRALCG